MSAFGQKRSFKFYAYACILTVNERLLSAISGHWLTVNATPKPPHLGASRAYFENVTAAQFCKEGGTGLEIAITKLLANFYKLRPFENRVCQRIRSNN